jgi:hypothetical protein
MAPIGMQQLKLGQEARPDWSFCKQWSCSIADRLQESTQHATAKTEQQLNDDPKRAMQLLHKHHGCEMLSFTSDVICQDPETAAAVGSRTLDVLSTNSTGSVNASAC